MDLNQEKNARHEQCNNAMWCRIGYSDNLLWNHSWAIDQSHPPIMSHFLLVYEYEMMRKIFLGVINYFGELIHTLTPIYWENVWKDSKDTISSHGKSFCLFFDKGALCHFAIFAQRRSDKFRRFEQKPRQIIDQNTNRSSLAIKWYIGEQLVIISDKDTSLF